MQDNYLNHIMDTYGNMIYRLALSYLKSGHDAEDIVQDVLVKLLEKPQNFENAEHEKAWLIRVAINLCKNKLKHSKHTSDADMSELEKIADHTLTEKDTTVLDAVMGLPEKYRVVVHLYYYEGYKTAEIAKILNKNESSIRSLLHRARAELKEVLKGVYDFG